MNPIATVGGPAHIGAVEADPVLTGAARIVYGRTVPRGSVYRLRLSASARLTALIVATDEGFVAQCRELGSLGYGMDRQSALDHLIETTCEYLTFLLENKPPLAPVVAHHAMYMSLLDIPAEAWFVAVAEIARSAPDAS